MYGRAIIRDVLAYVYSAVILPRSSERRDEAGRDEEDDDEQREEERAERAISVLK